MLLREWLFRRGPLGAACYATDVKDATLLNTLLATDMLALAGALVAAREDDVAALKCPACGKSVTIVSLACFPVKYSATCPCGWRSGNRRDQSALVAFLQAR